MIDFAIVPDIALPGAFDQAVKGATSIAHTASPFGFGKVELMDAYALRSVRRSCLSDDEFVTAHRLQ